MKSNKKRIVRSAPQMHMAVQTKTERKKLEAGDLKTRNDDDDDKPRSFCESGFVCVKALDFVTTRKEMKKYNLTHVVSVIDVDEEQYQDILAGISNHKKRHLLIRLEDENDEALRFGNTYFVRLVYWLQNALRTHPKARIVIHCYGGISRSQTAALAFLLATTNMCLTESLAQLRCMSRPEADPLESFLKHLERWNQRYVKLDLSFVDRLVRLRLRRILRLIASYANTVSSCSSCDSCQPSESFRHLPTTSVRSLKIKKVTDLKQ